MTSQRTFPPPIQGHSSDDESSISSFEDPSDGKPKNDPFPFEYGTSPPPLRNLPKDSFTDGFSPATTDFASDAKKVDFLSTPQFETPPDGNTVPRPVEKDAFDAMSASKTNDKEKEKHSASTIGAQDSPHVVGSRNRFFTRDASPLNATHPRNHSFSWNPKSTDGGVHRTDTPLHVTENCSSPVDNPKSYRDDGDSDTLPPQPSGSFTPTTHIGRTALYHDRSSPAVPVSATNVAPSPLAPSPSGSLDPSSKELSDTAMDQLRAQEVYINGLQTHKTLITQWKHLLQQVQSVELNEKLKIIQKQKEMIRDEEKLLETKRREFDLLFAALNRRESDLSRENEKIFQKLHEPSVKEQEAKLEERSKIIEERMDEMQRLYDMIEERRSRLRQKETELDYRERQVSFREADLNRKHREMESNLRERQVAVDRREHQATTWMRSLDLRERDVQKREDQVKQQLVEISQREVKLKTKNVSALEKAQETYSSWAQLALNYPDIEVLDKDSMSDDSDSESVESEERFASTDDEDPNTDKDDDNDGSGDDADPSTDIKIMTSLDEPTPPVSFNVVI